MIDLSSPNFILSLIMLTINHVLAFGHFGEVSSIFSFIFRVPAVKFGTVSGGRNLIYTPEVPLFATPKLVKKVLRKRGTVAKRGQCPDKI